MKKREFIKNVCAIGACSCTASLFVPEVAEAKTEDDECKKAKELNWKLEWRLNHAKGQMGMLLNKIEPHTSSELRREIMEDMGRNCAKSIGWAQKYKDNSEGFFEHMSKHSGEKISFNKSKDKITVITRERDCDCPIVDSSKTPSYYCDCSIGWQKETYEVILGKKVEVTLPESVLRGSKRCVFEIQILDS